ncbi:hypothetical protein SASPL_131199 [Salvia splendens]|uniref:Uncharacterized protein n=1 Tax=Salvia splendens TaxID=180675 RepID=A0A8X8X5I5_SALSN|nr:hypothetical protein SASPL_131199 [Salvia splendens]
MVYFASTIYKIKPVHLTLPTITHSTESADEICELLPKLAGFTSEEMSEFIKSSPIKELGFFSFVRNFKELRSISLEIFLELPAYVPGQASSSDEASLSDASSSDDEYTYIAPADHTLLLFGLKRQVRGRSRREVGVSRVCVVNRGLAAATL